MKKNKGCLSTIKERFNLLNDIIVDLSKNNKVNLMIFDGDMTYIHSNMMDSLYYLKIRLSFVKTSAAMLLLTKLLGSLRKKVMILASVTFRIVEGCLQTC